MSSVYHLLIFFHLKKNTTVYLESLRSSLRGKKIKGLFQNPRLSRSIMAPSSRKGPAWPSTLGPVAKHRFRGPVRGDSTRGEADHLLTSPDSRERAPAMLSERIDHRSPSQTGRPGGYAQSLFRAQPQL